MGGNGGDSGRDIVVDASGAAYVVGDTKSTNFPVWRAFDSRNNGGDDGFVTKLSADGEPSSPRTSADGGRGCFWCNPRLTARFTSPDKPSLRTFRRLSCVLTRPPTGARTLS
ncbi:MAG: SBBP repeat-containing protein [Blastocatellia bacterium]|nr:SBBP repeat-containing protein [Blastocatellia bacterium]